MAIKAEEVDDKDPWHKDGTVDDSKRRKTEVPSSGSKGEERKADVAASSNSPSSVVIQIIPKEEIEAAWDFQENHL